MTPTELLVALGKLAQSIDCEIGSTRWFVFGSAVHDLAAAADIDILVICEDDHAADCIRRSTPLLLQRWPIDLAILTTHEEQEVGFVGRQNCREVYST